MTQRDDLLVWIDLEMTSLVDPTIDSITQIACVITDKDLATIAESEEITIHADPKRFEEIPEQVRVMYQDNGLIPSILASTVTEKEAEARILSFIKEYVSPKSSPMCGNSIHGDRMFIKFRMPELNEYLHYRNIDISTIKELARRWQPEIASEVIRMKAGKTHRALDDIKGSIEELRHYRNNWLK